MNGLGLGLGLGLERLGSMWSSVEMRRKTRDQFDILAIFSI